MKKIGSLILLLVFTNVLSAAKFSGYYVTKANDTIQTTFKLNISMMGTINLKRVRRFVKVYNKHNKKEFLYPNEVQFIKIVNDIDSLEINLESVENMFMQSFGTGKLKMYVTEVDDAMWILNKYQSPTKQFYFIKLVGQPMQKYAGWIKPKDWIDLLGKDYPDFVDCLRWNGKKNREMKKLDTPCFWSEKSFDEISKLFNEKYP